MIPYGKQNISKEDLDQIKEVLNSDFLTQGPKITEFEEAICSSTNANHATAVSSATAALHIACLSLGVKKGDIVWTSPISFVASSNCALYCGANIDFDRLRYISERTEIGEKREAILAVSLDEKPGSFKNFCKALGKRTISEFNYRYSDSKQAQLERLYLKDGRADPCHRLHGSYMGLKAKYWGWSVS